MDSPILIGIHSVKRAGKGTLARFIKEWGEEHSPALVARDRGFADKAKWAFARIWMPDISMQDAVAWADKFKDNPAAGFTLSHLVNCGQTVSLDPHDDVGTVHFRMPLDPHDGATVQFREALRQFSTEGARDIYGDDHWVDQLLPLGRDPLWSLPEWWHEFSYKADENSYAVPDLCTISDIRFENEIKRVKQVDGIAVKIRRKAAEDAVIEEARRQGREVHRSELGLPDEMFDFIINNDDNDMQQALRRTRQAMLIIATHSISNIRSNGTLVIS